MWIMESRRRLKHTAPSYYFTLGTTYYVFDIVPKAITATLCSMHAVIALAASALKNKEQIVP